MAYLEALREWLRRLTGTFRHNGDLERELESHLEMAEDELRRRGHSSDEAARLARARFGIPARAMERLRDQQGVPWLGRFSLDVTLALRVLRKHWGVTLIAGIAMAIPIVLGAVLFAFVEATLWKAPPLDEGDRLVALQIWDAAAGVRRDTSIADFERWSTALTSVDTLGAFRTVERNIASTDGAGEPVFVAEITSSGFDAARTPPLLGRQLLPADERADVEPAVVIGYDFWRSRFDADPGVLGRELQLGRTIHTVVGVMPRGFAFPLNHELWTALRIEQLDSLWHAPEGVVFGRLAPGFELEQADAELKAVGLRAPPADAREQLQPRVVPYTFAFTDDTEPDELQWQFRLLLAFAALLLVPPCANAAILVYARNVSRQGEFAARCALGATRRRIVAQLFVEALVLAAAATATALAAAHFVLRFGQARLEQSMGGSGPFWMNLDLSLGTIAFSAALAVLAAGIAGLIPALQGTGSLMQSGLRALNGSTGLRLGVTWSVLVTAQVAFALAALPAVVEVAWGMARPGILGPGFAAENVLTARITTGPVTLDGVPRIRTDAERRELAAAFAPYRMELVDRLRAEPGVAAVTASSAPPNNAPWARLRVEAVGETTAPRPLWQARSLQIDDAFLDTYGISLLAGRAFTAADFEPAATAVIVTRNLAELLAGGAGALGLQFRYLERDPITEAIAPTGTTYEIVGVAAELFANSDWGSVYHPASPEQLFPASISIRVGADAASVADTLRAIATGLDPDARVTRIRTVGEIYRDQQIGNFAGASALAGVTLSVLLLSVAGIYALMSFTVNQRRREIGIRAALGAEPHRLLAGVFRRAFAQLAAGAVFGMLAAAAVERFLAIEQLGGRNVPGVLPAAAAFIVAIGVLASLGPARRALRVAPSEALRDGG